MAERNIEDIGDPSLQPFVDRRRANPRRAFRRSRESEFLVNSHINRLQGTNETELVFTGELSRRPSGLTWRWSADLDAGDIVCMMRGGIPHWLDWLFK